MACLADVAPEVARLPRAALPPRLPRPMGRRHVASPTYPSPRAVRQASGIVSMTQDSCTLHRDPCQLHRDSCHCIGIHDTASRSVHIAARSVRLYRDPCTLPQDPCHCIGIRARYSNFLAPPHPDRAATVTGPPKPNRVCYSANTPARYSTFRAHESHFRAPESSAHFRTSLISPVFARFRPFSSRFRSNLTESLNST